MSRKIAEFQKYYDQSKVSNSCDFYERGDTEDQQVQDYLLSFQSLDKRSPVRSFDGPSLQKRASCVFN